MVGLVACGGDDGGSVDGGPDSPDGAVERDSGDPPRKDGGDLPKEDGGDQPGRDAAPEDSGEPEPDAEVPEPDAGVDAGGPLTLGGLTVTVDPEDHDLNLFGDPGHRFWFEVSEEQLEELNNPGGGGYYPYPGHGDIYVPGGSSAYFADHLLIENAATGEVADYGKVEIDLVGGSTYRQWTPSSIPNVRIDSNEFNKDTRLGTFEHLRLNNSVIGTIFGEAMVHRVFRALNYPALRSSHVFLGGTAWGEQIWVPVTLVEMYKRRFCRDNEELLGGSCENMWEFASDLGYGHGGGYYVAQIPRDWCQVSECDDTRLIETIEALGNAPRGTGFKEAMDPYIAWDLFHRFQCISWILHIGDSALQGGNNTVVIERDSDHKLVWAPYSVDISTATEWAGHTSLTGSTSIAIGCQQDPACWADTIAVCEDVIMAFDELNPEEMIDEMVTTLTDLDMMRFGDDARAERFRTWYANRQTQLAAELEQYRFLPDPYGNCPDDMILCGDGGCGTVEACEGRECSGGQQVCESTGYCMYEGECPVCTETSPFYCDVVGDCVADSTVCQQYCEYQGEGQYVWCDALNRCVPYFFCQYNDDGGVIAGNGGIGGFPGMGWAGVPGGMAGGGVAGAGAIPLPAP